MKQFKRNIGKDGTGFVLLIQVWISCSGCIHPHDVLRHDIFFIIAINVPVRFDRYLFVRNRNLNQVIGHSIFLNMHYLFDSIIVFIGKLKNLLHLHLQRYELG